MSKRTHGNIWGRANAWMTRCGSMPATLGTPAGTSRNCCGQRRTAERIARRGSGFTATGWSTALEQRQVVDAVGVGPARGHVDAVVLRPDAHGLELPGTPHEQPVDGAVVGTFPLAVAGGDHIVDAEGIRQGLHQVERRRRGDDHLPSRLVVLVDEDPCEGLDVLDQSLGRPLTHSPYRIAVPPVGHPGGLTGEQHGGQRLADHVEDLVDERLTGDVAVRDEAGRPQPLGDDGPARTAQQRPVEIEERRSVASHGRTVDPGVHSRRCAVRQAKQHPPMGAGSAKPERAARNERPTRRCAVRQAEQPRR